MISPVEFIPLLEKSRLIIPVGEFVLNEAAKMCREMQQYIADFRVNINVSYIQIMRGSMANKILTAIRANNLRPESICIEMTESGFMDMTPCFCSFRKKLDENNIQFIIDDFGTGYNNMMAVDIFAPHIVKLDRSLITDIENDVDKQEYYFYYRDSFHKRGIKVLAEGVESREEYEFLRDNGIDLVQGFYLGRPQ